MARIVGGRYRLDEELASGGFGTVWRAWDQVLRVDVAVKQVRLDPSASDAARAKAVARAEAEARSAAKLRDHPNVVAVHDVAFDDGVPWLVMRLVRGHSLHAELAARGRLHPDEAGRIAVSVLEALATAHDAGIVHRDVKPANIMLADDGTVLLTDFGIAKNHDESGGTTHGVVLGSLPYMSPERLDGENPPAGDMFALGVTLYEMTEGVSPFARATPTAVIAAVARHDPAPPAHAGRLREVILVLLEKDAAKRPNARTVLRMLTAGGAAPTVAAEPSPAATRRTAQEPHHPSPGSGRQPTAGPDKGPTRTLRIKDATGLGLALRIHVDGTVVGTVRPHLIEKVPLTGTHHQIHISTTDGALVSHVITTDPADSRPPSFTVELAKQPGLPLQLTRDDDRVASAPTENARRTLPYSASPDGKRRIRWGRALLITFAAAFGALALMGIVMAVGIAVFQRDVQEARTGDCVVKTNDGRWHKELCLQFFQPDNKGSYKVLLRINSTADAQQCLSQAPTWAPGDVAHIVPSTFSEPAFVLCLRPE